MKHLKVFNSDKGLPKPGLFLREPVQLAKKEFDYSRSEIGNFAFIQGARLRDKNMQAWNGVSLLLKLQRPSVSAFQKRRNETILFSVDRKKRGRYIGVLSNDRCLFAALSKARKGLHVTKFSSKERLFWNSEHRNFAEPAVIGPKLPVCGRHTACNLPSKMKYCKKKFCCSRLDKRPKDSKFTRKVKVTKLQKIPDIYNQKSLDSKKQSLFYPRSIQTLTNDLSNEHVFKRHSSSASEREKDVPTVESTAFQINATAVQNCFPMEKLDKFLLTLILLALLCAAVRNLFEGLSDVPRPPGRGF